MTKYAIYHIVVFDISLNYIHKGYLQKYVTKYLYRNVQDDICVILNCLYNLFWWILGFLNEMVQRFTDDVLFYLEANFSWDGYSTQHMYFHRIKDAIYIAHYLFRNSNEIIWVTCVSEELRYVAMQYIEAYVLPICVHNFSERNRIPG